MEPDLFVPGDEQLEPMGIEPLLPTGQIEFPDFKKVAGNVIKNRALDYAAGKLGLNAAQASGIISSLGISDYLANKRAQKAIQKNIQNDSQGDVKTYPTGIMQMQPTKQDEARGSMPSKAPSKTYSAPQQTAGSGGLHNYD